jgi:SAM-dependent methyltransferase
MITRSEILDQYQPRDLDHGFENKVYNRRFIKEVVKPFKNRLLRVFSHRPVRLLDLASGTGKEADYFDQDPDCQAVRFDISMAGLLRSHGERVRGLAQELPFAPNSFHGVMIKDAIVHIDNKAELFEQIADVLTPKGKLLVVSAECIINRACVTQTRPNKRELRVDVSVPTEEYWMAWYQKMINIIPTGLVFSPPYFRTTGDDLTPLAAEAGLILEDSGVWVPKWGEKDWYCKPIERYVLVFSKLGF